MLRPKTPSDNGAQHSRRDDDNSGPQCGRTRADTVEPVSARVEISKVSKTYAAKRSRSDVAALTDIDVTIDEGETLTLLGPSGCGKTTLLADDRRTRIHHGRLDHHRWWRGGQGAGRKTDRVRPAVPSLAPLANGGGQRASVARRQPLPISVEHHDVGRRTARRVWIGRLPERLSARALRWHATSASGWFVRLPSTLHSSSSTSRSPPSTRSPGPRCAISSLASERCSAPRWCS